MGRYLLYYLHPLTFGETIGHGDPGQVLSAPSQTQRDVWDALFTHGGFPEPFLRRDLRFGNQWLKLRHNQLFLEDTRELTRIHDLAQLEVLGEILAKGSGNQVVYSRLSKMSRVDEKTIRGWIETLTASQ